MRVRQFAFLSIVMLVVTAAVARADVDLLRRIREINQAIADGNHELPTPIDSADVEDYVGQVKHQVSRMTTALSSAKAGLHPSLVAEGEVYRTMMSDLGALEALHARVSLLSTASFAAVLDKHHRGEPADAELDQLDRDIAKIARATRADAWARPHVAAFQRFAADLRTANGPIANAAAERRDRDLAASRARARLAEVARIRVLAARLTRDALDGNRLEADAIAGVAQAIAALDSPDATLFLRVDLLGLRLLERWQQPDGEAQQAIATLLGGKLEASGRSAGKQLAVKFTAVADRCYLLVGHFATQARDAALTNFAWGLARGHQVQAFHVAPFPHLARGFCTYQKEAVSAHADLGFVGSKNGVRWAVISFARDQLPADLEGGFRVERGDHCDPVYWEAMWTRPLPGTIAYMGREPVLVLSPSAVSSSEAYRLNDPSELIASGPLTSQPTGSIRFEPRELDFVHCPDDSSALQARAPASLAIIACEKRVAGKYAGAWAQIERQRGAARDAGGIAPAVENRATALMERQGRDEQACFALEQAATRAIVRVNERVTDRFLASPPIDPSQRADRYFRAAPFETAGEAEVNQIRYQP